jgi:hypothetical protein
MHAHKLGQEYYEGCIQNLRSNSKGKEKFTLQSPSVQHYLDKINNAGLSYDMYNSIINHLNSNYPRSAYITPEELQKIYTFTIPYWNGNGYGADYTHNAINFVDCPSHRRIISFNTQNRTNLPSC